MERVYKMIESLKTPVFSISSEKNTPVSITSAVVAASDAIKTKKKGRMEHCVSVTDAVLTSNVQNLTEFSKILANVTEVLFQLCNDPDSDIRLVAVDCLNKIVRTLRGTFLNKFQMEVFREIQKNQAPRPLRTALSVFAVMSSDIRPNRCRGFIEKLLPSLIQISKRTEELLYDNLASSFLQILKHLGLFLTDNDVKLLCKEYLPNLESNSIIVRRSSASILVYICEFSRKPNVFLPKLLVEVVELLMPNLMEKSVSTLIGVLLCVRQCLPPLYAELEKTFPGVLEKDIVYQNIILVYEICLILCNHDDHNVITTSLETLQQLLTCPVFEVSRRLTSPNGIQNSFDSEQWVRRNQLGTPPGPSSQWTSIGSELSESDEPSALPLENEFDLQAFRSELSSTASESKEDFDTTIVFKGRQKDSDIFVTASANEAQAERQNSTEVQSEEEMVKYNQLDNTTGLDVFPEIQIGSLYEKNVPLYYCTRFLAYNFLLSGRKGCERSDNEVRVTVKALAINCIINSIQLCPNVFFLSISPGEVEQAEDEKQQTISDVSLYAKHHDPLLRGSTYILIGHFLNRILRMNHGRHENFEPTFEELVSVLNAGLLDKSNIGVKFALSGLSECMVPILRSRDTPAVVEKLLRNLFQIIANPYWLVKVNLVELLATIEWDSVLEHEELQDKTLNLLVYLLSDEDVRVRLSAGSALVKFIQKSGEREDWIKGNVEYSFSRTVIGAISCDMFKLPDKVNFHSNVSKHLAIVLNRIIPQLIGLEEKHSIAGFYSALSSLSEVFSPSVYKIPWRCGHEEIPLLFSIVIELLRSSTLISDMIIHQNLLMVSSNLFLALVNQNVQSPIDEKSPFLGSHKNMSVHGLFLLHHCYNVVKLYNSILCSDSGSGGILLQKKPPPVLSPARKFLSKDPAKKSMDAENDKKTKQLQRQQSNPNSNSICPVQQKRIKDSLQQSWKVYKSNLDPVVTHKFTSVLVTSLDTLRVIFGWTRFEYVGITTIIEDILAMAPNIFNLTPVPTLKCMQAILCCLNSPIPPAIIENFWSTHDSLAEFQKFCENFYKGLVASRKSGLHQSSSEKSSLGSHIHSFEPIVIAALKMHLASSDSSIQAEVLLFVTELVKRHVNYSMVDQNQVFLNSVIKQLNFLEEGHVRNSAILVDAIFEYFTHLSHMDRSAKKIIDTPKMLQLCDGLVASGQNPTTNYIPALKKVVYDLFIRRGGHSGVTNLEKKEIEAQREVLFQSILKLGDVPDALPLLFVLLQGRRVINEAKWSTESGIVARTLLESIETNKLSINNLSHFICVIGILFSVHATTLPSLEKLKHSLEEALLVHVEDPASLSHWMVTVNCFWLVVLRTVHQNEESVPSKFFLRILLKFIDQTEIVFTWTGGVESLKESFFVEQLVIFLKTTTSLLGKGASGDLISELVQEENVNAFSTLVKKLTTISFTYPSLRKALCELLTALTYPYTQIWDLASCSWSQPSETVDIFVSELVSSLIGDLVSSVFGMQNRACRTIDTQVTSSATALEVWLIQNYSYYIIHQSSTPEVASFWTRISESSRDLLIQKLTDMTDEPNLSDLQVSSALRFMERAYEKYKKSCALLCIKLLKMKTTESILFSVSQFACFLYVQLHGEENLFSEDDLQVLRNFQLDTSTGVKYPRLVSLIGRLLGTGDISTGGNISDEYATLASGGPVANWCCEEEINQSDGIALAKILSNLKYTHINKVLHQEKFNLSILKYIFQHLQSQVQEGQIQTEDLITLLSTDRHSSLIETLPVGVAAVDKIVSILDSWETSTREPALIELWEHKTPFEEVSFQDSLCYMWEVLTELLQLKSTVLADTSLREKAVYNNYIPTTMFTLSFLYTRTLCRNEGMKRIPLHKLSVFLRFANAALNDSSFLQFFNVRDNSFLIFKCIHSLGTILRGIISYFRISYVTTESEESWSELNEECMEILKEFNSMLDVVYQVKSRRIFIEESLFEELKSVIGGLARCELVNAWVLISHLGWKPPLTSKTQIFPPIQHIPLDILQNEKDLLLKYIFKINMFGISSKIQFEENWMTLLSVINSYSYEHYNLQIIIIGLQGLSMMLEHAVKVIYTPDLTYRKPVNGLQNIMHVLKDLEPEICKSYVPPLLHKSCTTTFDNEFHIDITSCVRFLIDLFSEWIQNTQGKIPLHLISKVVECTVNISKYFDDSSQYVWMFDTLMEIHKGSEKEDETLRSHLVLGIFIAASKSTVDAKVLLSLGHMLESGLVSQSANVANGALKNALVYFQNQPDSLSLLNIVVPYVLNSTQLSETLNDTESHSYRVWKLLLFIWIYCSSSGVGGVSFEQDVVGNILTVLSPLNKVHVSIRLMVLQSLRTRVEIGGLKPETKKNVTKAAIETLRTPNIAIYYESMKLFLTIFYADFAEFYGVHDPDPEVLMQMVERSEILFQLLKNERRFNSQVASKVLPVLLRDFLPPSEILNRVISEFLAPSQTSPELLAPTIASIFEKARRKRHEAVLVREWIQASLPNFVSSPDVSRTMWNLSLFFIGVSTSDYLFALLPVAQLKRNGPQIKKLFIHSALDYYRTLTPSEQETFEAIFRKGPFSSSATNPYEFLVDLIGNLDQ